MKLIIRNLFRNKLTSFALIFSLAIGFVSYIAISSYVINEKTYDQYIPDYENIYRIVTEAYSNNELAIKIPQCERILGESIVEKYPQVTESGFLCKTNNPQYKIGENTFTDENVFHASPGLLDIFSIQIIKSQRSDLLVEPYKILISESIANKYFGDIDPIGEKIFKYPGYEYEIEGVFKNIPENTHFKADMFLSFHDDMRLPPPLKDNWGETSFYTYLKIDKNTNLSDIESGINQLVLENKKSYFDNTNSLNQYKLQALKDIHLKSNLKNEIDINGRNDYLNILLIISFLILLASGFNYVYFSYNKILSNLKDLAIKKVFGITQAQLIKQFLSESVIIHAFALGLSLIVCIYTKQIIYNTLGIDISISFSNINFWLILITVFVLSSILTVVFPIFIFNNKRPLELLSDKKLRRNKKFSFKQLIIVIQFVMIISILSIIMGIDKQLNFLLKKDKGLNISNSLVIKVPSNIRKNSSRLNNLEAFEQELVKHQDISAISSCSSVPGDILGFNFSVSEKGTPNSAKAALLISDHNFAKIFNLQFLSGNNFNDSLSQANAGCIINQTCLKKLGYQDPEDAIGRILKLADESAMQNFEVSIIGVCNDFNFQSLKESPDPTIILNWTQNMLWGNYIVKINNLKNIDSVNSFINSKFHETFTNYPFEYFWLEDHYNKQFVQEQKLAVLLKIFVLLIIFISTINLFSIVWNNTILRTKEIGIRKVNGATVIEIIKMLNIDILKWILYAAIIAFPISFYSLTKWIDSFAYKVSLDWWIFVFSGFFALIIGSITISWQTFKVANMNPAAALRYE